MLKVSVVMATYNGEKYIQEQVNSILDDLSENDELIISDDGSKDQTLNLVKEINDKRVKIVAGPQKGFVKNFENAFNYSSGDIVFFSDQDDVWVKGKRNKVIDVFKNPKINVVKHDAIIVDQTLKVLVNSYNEQRGANVSYVRNIIVNTFTGCCMACRKDWLASILPVPDGIYHDWWIGVHGCKEKCVEIINDKLILYRRHDSNVSSMKPDGLFKRLKKRIHFVKELRKK